MFGYLDHLTGSMRNSILGLGMWFSIGLVLLIVVLRIQKRRKKLVI